MPGGSAGIPGIDDSRTPDRVATRLAAVRARWNAQRSAGGARDALVPWAPRATRYPSTRSTTVAIPCPTPMHIVARP